MSEEIAWPVTDLRITGLTNQGGGGTLVTVAWTVPSDPGHINSVVYYRSPEGVWEYPPENIGGNRYGPLTFLWPYQEGLLETKVVSIFLYGTNYVNNNDTAPTISLSVGSEEEYLISSLTRKKTFNARVQSGVVKRGKRIDDWIQYGLYYGDPAYLEVHDFSSWDLIVFDISFLWTLDRASIAADVLIYLPWGSDFRKAATINGATAPAYDAAGVENFLDEYRSKIDDIFAQGCNGVFFDECDVGYWDPNYAAESAQIMRDMGLAPLCDYVRAYGGRSIVNGATWFAKVGEIFLLESFVGHWTGNPFRPSWGWLPFFWRYGQSLGETGELGGVDWTTGIRAYLYIWKYANTGPRKTVMYGHTYGDPESPWQNDRQLICYAAFRASGIASFNYISPDNQILRELLVHRYYLGAPLEPPQFDLVNETISRRFSGGKVFYNGKTPEASYLNLDVSPGYWFDIGRDFENVPWDSVQVQSGAGLRQTGNIPNYLRIASAKSWDDRSFVYLRVEMETALEQADSIPVFVYMQLDGSKVGWQSSLQADNVSVYLHFGTIKVQLYLYWQSLFVYQGAGGSEYNFRYLYGVDCEKKGSVMYWRIRKETLRFCMPTWNGTTIKWIPCYEGASGSGFFISGSLVAQDESPMLSVNGHLTNTMVTPLAYVPHTAVMYKGLASNNRRIIQVSIVGTWEKAWVFDRKTGTFIGPDGTPDTWFTASPFNPPRNLDARDVYVLVAGNNGTSATEESFAVSGVTVILATYTINDAPGYDVPPPDLIEWQSVYDGWEYEKLPASSIRTFVPMGINRGTVKFKKDTLTDRFVITVQGTDAIANLLNSTDIRGAKVVLRRTFEDADHTDPDRTETMVVAYVESWELAEGGLTIQARTNLQNWQASFPRRRLSYFCPYIFKDPRCAYGGVVSTCDKTLPICQALGNVARFGGFPTLPRMQRGKWG
ncbi:MAG: hypothetical protein HQL74_05870 [Magnetococcales bacterium]|nr:hypothetical protein [Magnetococcales bacterium]